jgi:hypothetical protein
MPLIKDKDRYKKISARDRGRARLGENPNLPNKLTNNTQREKQESIDKSRSEDISVSNKLRTISFSVPTEDTVENIFTLDKGDTLENLIITQDGTSGYFEVAWSYGEPDEITHKAGTIESSAGPTTLRLVRETSRATSYNFSSILDRQYEGSGLFNEVSRRIYFYYLSDRPSYITYVIS